MNKAEIPPGCYSSEDWAAMVQGETAQSKPPDLSRLNIAVAEWALQDMGVTLRWNLLLNEMDIAGLPGCYSRENAANILPILLSDHLKDTGCKGVSQQAIDGVLTCIADKGRFNPVADFLTGGEWDGTDRMAEIYSILGIQDERHKTYVRKWLIQCVALGLNDDGEAGADGVLVLQGPQGCGKTSFFRKLVPNKRWFVEGAVIDMRDRDSLLNALGAWITELGELDATLKREQSALKGFLTAKFNEIRRPYARCNSIIPRRTSFAATVNPSDYLRDETGSRRFWTVPVERIDKKRLFSLSPEWIAQLWYQVYETYQQNHDGFRLDDAEMEALQAENAAFEKPLKGQAEVEDILQELSKLGDAAEMRFASVSEFKRENMDILRQYSVSEIGKVLERLGYKQEQRRVAGAPKRGRLLPFKKYGEWVTYGGP